MSQVRSFSGVVTVTTVPFANEKYCQLVIFVASICVSPIFLVNVRASFSIGAATVKKSYLKVI